MSRQDQRLARAVKRLVPGRPIVGLSMTTKNQTTARQRAVALHAHTTRRLQARIAELEASRDRILEVLRRTLRAAGRLRLNER